MSQKKYCTQKKVFQRCRSKNRTVFPQTTNQSSLTRNTNFICFSIKKTFQNIYHLPFRPQTTSIKFHFGCVFVGDVLPFYYGIHHHDCRGTICHFFHPHLKHSKSTLRVMEVKSSFLPIQSHPFSGWWQLNDFSFSPLKLGMTHSWFNHQPVLDIKKKNDVHTHDGMHGM